MRKVYLASFYDDYPRMQEVAKQLAALFVLHSMRGA